MTNYNGIQPADVYIQFSNLPARITCTCIVHRGGATAKLGGAMAPPKILKNYFILCISIKKFKYLATKIEVGPPKCLS